MGLSDTAPIPTFMMCPKKMQKGDHFKSDGGKKYIAFRYSHEPCYLWNYYNGWSSPTYTRVLKVERLKQPSVYVTHTENMFISNSTNHNAGQRVLWATEKTVPYMELRMHGSGSNYLHADGHAVFAILSEGARGASPYDWWFYPNGKYE